MSTKDTVKTIDTLVDDIYGLFEGGEIPFDAHDLFVNFGEGLTEIMKERFSEVKKGRRTLRLSNIGKPDRQLWYDINYEGNDVEELLPKTLIKFTYGDILEHYLLLLARLAGHTVEFEQQEVEVNEIKGHPDALIDGVVVDVKSASTFAFEKFRTGRLLEVGNDPFGYVGQLASYVKAMTPGKEGYFLAIDKQHGTLCILKVEAEKLLEYDVEGRIEYAKEMVKRAEPPEKCEPDVPDGKSGNRRLGTLCSYCKHKFHCWSDANDGTGLRVFLYSTGPKYLTQVEKEPRVFERDEF